MKPFESRQPLDAKTRLELERLESATKSRVFGHSQKDSETAAMRESWVLFAQLLDSQSHSIDVSATVSAIENRLQARRRRRIVRWSSGLLGLTAAACIAIAIFPDVVGEKKSADARPNPSVATAVDDEWTFDLRPWRDRLDDAFDDARIAVEDWEHEFHQPPTAIAHATNQALALARELEESTL